MQCGWEFLQNGEKKLKKKMVNAIDFDCGRKPNCTPLDIKHIQSCLVVLLNESNTAKTRPAGTNRSMTEW